MDMQDWIILRLMRTALKTNHKFSHTRDFVETAVYLSKKYGDHAIGQATQELLNEEREKEAQRQAALANPLVRALIANPKRNSGRHEDGNRRQKLLLQDQHRQLSRWLSDRHEFNRRDDP